MEKVRYVVFCAAVVLGLTIGGAMGQYVQAQDAVATSKPVNTSPAIILSRELELEEQLQVTKDQRNFALDKNQALELQVQQLQSIVNQVLDNMRAERTKEASDSRAAVSRKLVAAMKGDQDKGDKWDWERRGLVHPDGTFVPLVKPEDAKKPEEKK